MAPIIKIKYARHFYHELISFIESNAACLFDYDTKSVYYLDKDSVPDNLSTDKLILPFKSLSIDLSDHGLD